MSYPVPEHEETRLKALGRLNILGTDSEEKFDQVADTAREFLGTKYSALNFISDDLQWSKASCGIDVGEVPREDSFCAHVVGEDQMLVVEDTESDQRFANNPQVTGFPHIRSYAGAPLTVEGHAVGTLCVFDDRPRSFTEKDRGLLRELATLVTELLKARLQTYQVQYLNSALEQVDEPVSIIEGDPSGPEEMEITWVNQAYVASVGADREALVGTVPWVFEELETGSEMRTEVRSALQDERSLRGETSGKPEGEAPYYVAWLLAPVRDEEGQVTHWISVQRDITDRRVREEQLEYRATHDPLTGLLNRSAIEERVQRAIHTEGKAGALLYLDLDKFKQVNDTYGHSAGDQLLKQVAGVLREALRQRDAVGRIGGDEFVAWFSPPISAETAERITERIIGAFDEPFDIQGEQLAVDFSIGLVQDISPYNTAEAALEDADIAMYEAKQSPDRTYVAHDPARADPAEAAGAEGDGAGGAGAREPRNGTPSSQRRLNPLIQEATEEGGFETFLHPIVRLSDGTLAGFEVLARWRRHNGELAPPGDFLEVAEETGLIVPIGRQVLEGACQALQKLRNEMAAGLSLTLSGNFSRQEFFQEETYEFIGRLLETYEIPPESFTMEITERTCEGESEGDSMPARELKALGLSVEIDDFGTGYSSLRSLMKFPADGLKIDKSLTSEITEITAAPETAEASEAAGASGTAELSETAEPSGTAAEGQGRQIARSVIEMARSLGLYVTAEGIETSEQLSVLRELGCDYGQGFLFSEPVPAEEAESLADTFPRDLSSL